MDKDIFLEGLISQAADPYNGSQSTDTLSSQQYVVGAKDLRVRTLEQQIVLIRCSNDIIFLNSTLGSGTLIPPPRSFAFHDEPAEFVLTAAHCVSFFDDGLMKYNSYIVSMLKDQKMMMKDACKLEPGDLELFQDFEVFPQNVFVYPKYADHICPVWGTDIALMKLEGAPNIKFGIKLRVMDSQKDLSAALHSFEIIGFPGELEKRYIQHASGDRNAMRSLLEAGFLQKAAKDGDSNKLYAQSSKAYKKLFKDKKIFDANRIEHNNKEYFDSIMLDWGFHHIFHHKGHMVANYVNQTSAGMSGGGLVMENEDLNIWFQARYLVGVHSFGGLADLHGGCILTQQIYDWILKTQDEHGERSKDASGWPRVHEYAGRGDLTSLKNLRNVDWNLNYDTVISYRTTTGLVRNVKPIHLAAYAGHIDVVKFLIEKMADVNAFAGLDDIDFAGHGVAIHFAINGSGSLDVVKELVPYTHYDHLHGPHKMLASTHRLDETTDIYALGAMAVGKTCNHRIILSALLHENIEVANLLLDSKCDINVIIHSYPEEISQENLEREDILNRYTPFAHLLIQEKATALKWCLEMGAKYDYYVPGMKAMLSTLPEKFRACDAEQRILDALKRNNLAMVRIIIDILNNIYPEGHPGRPNGNFNLWAHLIFMSALQTSNSRAILQYLYQNHSFGDSFACAAKKDGDDNPYGVLIAILESKNPNWENAQAILDIFQSTPHIAIRQQELELSLVHFVKKGDVQAVDFLLENKVDPNIPLHPERYFFTWNISESLLHMAVRQENPKMVRSLLCAKANPNTISYDGKTVLELAQRLKLREIEYILDMHSKKMLLFRM